MIDAFIIGQILLTLLHFIQSLDFLFITLTNNIILVWMDQKY
jgi:hypothetical protein